MNEDEAKTFALWWMQDQAAYYDKLVETSIAQLRTIMFDQMKRREDGLLEDAYFRGMEAVADSFLEGLRDSMQQQLDNFDELFAYKWYRYQKTLQETPND